MASVNDIRSAFLEFFKRNGHEVLPSSSLVPHNDPTLMFTNAGMNQFKNIFTGAEKSPFNRAATSQKCVRAGGKHNDLDNVGYTARHHTFFEMLGNFSFGDYFKEQAIEYGWNLLTKDFALNPEKLCVTVYHDDDVAWNHWKKLTGFADHKIIRISTNDNFWSMGDTGPCGPCSEIFYDHGDKIPGGPPGTPDADGDRFVEIWNLVFMQYEQLAGGERINLPKPSIDTGMGLERLAAVLQGVTDNYDIDLFKHLIASINEEAGKLGARIDKANAHSAAQNVLADHLRSSCFLMADGILPSNEGRGYVLRRIMRRGMRYAHQMGCREPLMYKLVPALIAEMGGHYPELVRAQASITDNLLQEEERFKQTLERGLKLLEEELKNAQADYAVFDSANADGYRIFPGELAFKLYDTYGFPLDLTQDILRPLNTRVDLGAFEKAMEGQRDMARAAHKGSGDVATSKIWFELKEKVGPTTFVGYDVDEADATILAIVKAGESVRSANTGDEVSIVLNQTPFYGESGGQVGDGGILLVNNKPVADIGDTQKPLEDFIVHKALLKMPIKVGDSVKAQILVGARNATRANHSATHLLHKALRDQLGEHVVQKGSLVDSNRLRFDFSNPKPVSREELAVVEKKVNEIIWRNTPVSMQEMAPDDAIKAGAMALFGEKYGDRVRVLSMGQDKDAVYSVELCGGTHVRNTGDIGLFKITSEGSVASGVRRIEAVTGEAVRDHMKEALQKQHEQVQKLEEEQARLLGELGKPLAKGASHFFTASLDKAARSELFTLYENEFAQSLERIAALQEENKKLGKELAEAKKQAALGAGAEATVEKIGNIQFIGKIFDGLDPKDLRGLAEGYLKQAHPGVVFVATRNEGKASIVIGVDKFLTDLRTATHLVQEAVAAVGGKGGGGRPEMAQGGGPDADKLDAAMDKIKALLAK